MSNRKTKMDLARYEKTLILSFLVVITADASLTFLGTMVFGVKHEMNHVLRYVLQERDYEYYIFHWLGEFGIYYILIKLVFTVLRKIEPSFSARSLQIIVAVIFTAALLFPFLGVASWVYGFLTYL